MPQLSVIVTEQAYKIIKAVLAATGKTQSSACGEWIYKGALNELQELQRAGIIPNPLSEFNLSTTDTPSTNNGERKAEVLSITTEEQMTDTPSITDTPTYQRGDRIRIVKVPKSKRGSNIIDQKGTLISRVNGGKWAIALDNGGNTELPEAYIEPVE
jgi:hypothetical protein